MKIIIRFIIFCLVLVLYLHINFQLRTSNDLEMYEIDNTSKDKFEEICDIKQPVLFNCENNRIIETTNIDYLLNNYYAFEVKVRNISEKECLYLPLHMKETIKLFDEDKKELYYSENNNDFLQESGVIKNLQYNDEFMRPYMVSNYNYDIMFGSENVTTPLRYEINYRNYFIVTQGSVKIKLCTPKCSKYLHIIKDYENLEFRSPINPWNTQPEYIADFDKIKFLEIEIPVGKIIYIPAYWWYSIKFMKKSSVSCFRYRTYMNNISIIPNIFMYALQNQNIKRDIIKKVNINENVNNISSKPKILHDEKNDRNTTSINEL